MIGKEEIGIVSALQEIGIIWVALTGLAYFAYYNIKKTEANHKESLIKIEKLEVSLHTVYEERNDCLKKEAELGVKLDTTTKELARVTAELSSCIARLQAIKGGE